MISRLTTHLRAVGALTVALLAFAALAGSAGAASSSSASQTVRFANRTTVRMQLATTAPYDFGPVDPLSARDPAGNENTATVWSNANWRLFVRAAGPAFTESPTGANTIPLNRLRVTGTRGVNLGVNDKRIANGAATGTAGVAVPINYALTLRFADKANTPGSNYQQILIYTAVTP
jgi:hypothetical protein